MTDQPITRVLKTAILPPGEPIFSDRATFVKIDDEAAGEFVSVSQDDGEININREDWPAIRDAINAAFEEIAKYEQP